jgi:fluoride ion exporter CrcB/FEX|tara:strand:- start:1151 stop:1543 length:393 start_codon:yes stop_codon:yes gene_type:complete
MDFASANSFSLVFDDNDDDAAKADPEFEEVLKEEGITIANVAADALIRALRLLELLFFVSSFVSSFPSSFTSSCCSCALTTFTTFLLAFLLMLRREERLLIKELVVVNVVAEEEDISSIIYICVDVLLLL